MVLKESMVNGPEIRSSGLVVFPEVLDRFSGNLAEKHLAVHAGVQRGYLKQKEVGFYVNETEQEWEKALDRDPVLAANNTLVRRGGLWESHRLKAVPYREAGFGRIFDEIADVLAEVRREARSLPDASLIANQTKILETGFKTGNTDAAMQDYINLRRHPQYGIWAGLLDRLLDKKRNLKFALQGWSTEQHDTLSKDFNLWSGLVLRGVGRLGYSDFIFTDVAIQSGLATERIWQGNTMPSQPDIAKNYGHLIYFFDNVSAWKTARDIEPRLRVVTPEEMLERIRRETLDRVRRAVIAAHEVGHAAQVIPDGSDRRLGPWFQVMKEIYADGFGVWSMIRYPEIILSRSQLPAALYFDLARAQALTDEYVERTTRGEIEDIINPYTYAAATKVNTLLMENAITRSSAGVFDLGDTNTIRETAAKYMREIDSLMKDGSRAQVEDFIMERSSHPVDFLRTAA